MTTKNALALTGKGGKYAHIFDNVEFNNVEIKVPTEDEQLEQATAAAIDSMADFFSMGIGAEGADVFRHLEKQIDEVEKVNVTKITEETDATLDTVSDKERKQEFEDKQFVFKRKQAEDQGLTEPPWSTSTDRVVDPNDRTRTEHVGTQSKTRMEQMRGSSSQSNSQRPDTSSDHRSRPTSSDGKTLRAIDEFQKMNHSVQKVGAARSYGWESYRETEEEYFSQFAKSIPLWKRTLRKGRNFFKGNKGRITLKMSIAIALQLGMGVFAKKFEFENKGQMFGMFTLMVMSFFMSKELANEGVDISGMIF